MAEALGRPRLLFHCQHTLGMGHLVRSLTLARALAAHFHVVFLNGGPIPRGVPRPDGIDVVDLPPLGLDDSGQLVTRDRRRSVAQAQRVRREVVLDVFTRTRPRVVVVELFPFGRKKFADELVPLFAATHAFGTGRPRLVTSLRDLLVVGRHDQARHDDRAAHLANRYLDAVLVHTDPQFARLEETFQPHATLRVPVHYTGFVSAERPLVIARATEPLLVVSAGGGLVGGPLFRAAVEAHALRWEQAGIHTTIVAGPFLPEPEWRGLRAAARGRRHLTIRRSVPDLAALLARAHASVSQCGYNTALDILRSRVPALAVPFRERKSDEQATRAERLVRLGAVRVLDPGNLNGSTLAAAGLALLDFEPAALALDIDGATRTATLLTEMGAA